MAGKFDGKFYGLSNLLKEKKLTDLNYTEYYITEALLRKALHVQEQAG